MIACLVLVAVAVGWVLAKLIKWTIHIIILFVLLGVLLFVVSWLLG